MAARSTRAPWTTIRGTVAEVETYVDGEARTGFVVIAADGVEHSVVEADGEHELDGLVDEHVEVRGVVSVDPATGRRSVEVLEVVVTSWEEEVAFDADLAASDDWDSTWDPEWDPDELGPRRAPRRVG